MKLVELLARELKEWPEGASMAVQDGDGQIKMAAGDEPENGNGKDSIWVRDVEVYHEIQHGNRRVSDDYRTAMVTRAEWEAERARIAKPEENKWIRHPGGKCPVADDDLVEVRYRTGTTNKEQAGILCWNHIRVGSDIMAYRLHKPELKDFKMPESSGSLHVTAPQTIPAHMILGYQSKEDMALATGCETMEEVMAKVSSDMDGVIVPGKIDQNDVPIKWRDRVREIDSTVEALEEERLGLIQRLEDEGFQLIKGKVEPQEDMSDWRNWRVEDEVECISSKYQSFISVGNRYTITGIRCEDEPGTIEFTDDDGDTMYYEHENFKFHSRPATK